MPESAYTLLAFDFGLRRIGVAVGGTHTRLAQPLTTIAVAANGPRFAAIAALIAQWQPQRLLVGLPLSREGKAQAMSGRCQRFARQLAGRFRLPVELADERLTSVEAEAQLKAAGRFKVQDKAAVDATAAAILLQDWLEAGDHGST